VPSRPVVGDFYHFTKEIKLSLGFIHVRLLRMYYCITQAYESQAYNSSERSDVLKTLREKFKSLIKLLKLRHYNKGGKIPNASKTKDNWMKEAKISYKLNT
jgi:hypothetical protein